MDLSKAISHKRYKITPLVIRELTLDIAYNYTKFDDSSFSNSRDISCVCIAEVQMTI